jgi:hypothetical protein
MVAAPSEAESVPDVFEDSHEGCTFEQAMLNAVNILLGVGLLSIPFAMSEGGWAALATLALLGGVTNYTGKVLGECQARLCLVSARPAPGEGGRPGALVRGLQSYEDIGEAAFGAWGRKVVTWVLYTELVGTCGLVSQRRAGPHDAAHTQLPRGGPSKGQSGPPPLLCFRCRSLT